LPGVNEENNEKLSTKIMGLRAEIWFEDSRRYVLKFQRSLLPPPV
jgi:hypothetical protein